MVKIKIVIPELWNLDVFTGVIIKLVKYNIRKNKLVIYKRKNNSDGNKINKTIFRQDITTNTN